MLYININLLMRPICWLLKGSLSRYRLIGEIRISITAYTLYKSRILSFGSTSSSNNPFGSRALAPEFKFDSDEKGVWPVRFSTLSPSSYSPPYICVISSRPTVFLSWGEGEGGPLKNQTCHKLHKMIRYNH